MVDRTGGRRAATDFGIPLPVVLMLHMVVSLILPGASVARGASGPAVEPLFYRQYDYGSEANFNPIRSFINYALDPIQVPESFDDDQFGDQLEETWDQISDPFAAIDEEGGFKDFVNRQIFPIDIDNIDDSIEMIPNYALHVIGAGMVYRKNVEWLQAHGCPYPRASAAILGMAAEFIHEVVEKKSTPDDDPVADFYLFRPAGMLLFSWDGFARFAARSLRLVEWSYQPVYRPRKGEFANVGENYVVRPALFGTEAHRPFVFFGMTTLAGLSHAVGAGDAVSWGLGGAVEEAARDNFGARPSLGLFYDRNDSLLASLILNGTDELAARLNVYPGIVLPGRWSPGLYLGVDDDGGIAVGVSVPLIPLGLGAAS